MQVPFVVLTGASGSGKTTIAHRIESEHPEITVFRFDTIGVPSAEVMATYGTGHQPGGAWLRAMTLEWFGKIAEVLASGRPVLFEGQMRIAFVLEALQVHGIEHARIICVECDDSTRTDRLTNDRLQPELANESMMGWSRYLHQEAIDAGYEVFDTTGFSPAESTAHILEAMRAANTR
jgi:hypothetical protein